MATFRQNLRRVWSLLTIGSTIQFVLVSLGGATVLVGAVTGALSTTGWLDTTDLILVRLGLVMLVFVALLALVSRFWIPKGPFAEYWGAAAVMVGQSDELDKKLFRRVPWLKRQSLRTAERVRRFVEEQKQQMPQMPTLSAPPTLEDAVRQQRYQRELSEWNRKAVDLYEMVWRRRVDGLFADARAMFFGPVPTGRHWQMPNGDLGQVELVARVLEDLSEKLPANYTDQLYAARISRLRDIKLEGLTLVADIRAFALRRQTEASAIADYPTLLSGEAAIVDRWNRENAFSGASETRFATEYGGALLHVIRQLREFGVFDEMLDMNTRSGVRVDSIDIPTIPGLLEALCRRIPYD